MANGQVDVVTYRPDGVHFELSEGGYFSHVDISHTEPHDEPWEILQKLGRVLRWQGTRHFWPTSNKKYGQVGLTELTELCERAIGIVLPERLRIRRVMEHHLGRAGFRPLPPPTTAELHALTVKVARKVIRVLRRRGLVDETLLDDAAADEPALTELLAESVAFPRARIVDPGQARPAPDRAWLGSVAGFNLHAGVALSALDREGRERLCRYLLRPPVSDDRLSLREDSRVALQLKTPWRDGTVALLFTPEQFVARLAALVPRPGKNLVRYHGVLAPNARARAKIVPSLTAAPDADGGPSTPPAAPAPPKARTGRYLLWHELLRRVFEIDVLSCPKCGGRLRLLCTVHDGFSARRYLQGVSAQSPPAEARPPPEPAATTSA